MIRKWKWSLLTELPSAHALQRMCVLQYYCAVGKPGKNQIYLSSSKSSLINIKKISLSNFEPNQ